MQANSRDDVREQLTAVEADGGFSTTITKFAPERGQTSVSVLRALAQELTDKMRKSATINWQNRKSSRARMLAMVKVLLAKHKYPPDAQPDATDKVIAQAELLADTWAFEHP